MLQAERKPGSLASLGGRVDGNHGMLQQGTSASFACNKAPFLRIHCTLAPSPPTAEGHRHGRPIQLFPITVGGNNTSAFNLSILSARRELVAVNVPDAFIAQLSPLCIA